MLKDIIVHTINIYSVCDLVGDAQNGAGSYGKPLEFRLCRSCCEVR